EPASFNRSSRGVGTRIEIEYDPFAFVIFEGDFVTVMVKRSKVRGFIIDFHGIFSLSVYSTVIPQSSACRHLGRLHGRSSVCAVREEDAANQGLASARSV